jgi:transposase
VKKALKRLDELCAKLASS